MTATDGVHINGTTIAGNGTAQITIHPATGEQVEAVTTARAAQVAEATSNANQAQAAWSAKTCDERAKILLTLADVIEQDAENLIKLEVEETSKSRAGLRDGEFPFAADNLHFFARYHFLRALALLDYRTASLRC